MTSETTGTPARSCALGPFELVRPLGRGGGGEVWLGRHERLRTLVAVKIITAAGSHEEPFRARFAEEVRAVARLDHPGIVTIIDHGHVEREMIAGDDLRIPAGSPFLIMELARAGTLPALEPLRNFGELQRVLLALLDALAHAHARGVVHRDIKPGNVLLCSEDRRRPLLKLTDFGIAYATEHAEAPHAPRDQGARAGTPSYMAPEQIRGDDANHGPWTDLYALGCLAYRLVTGRPPFCKSGRDTEQILEAHLHAVAPPMVCRFSIPVGFSEWLAVMMAKAPWERFQCAADASAALLALDEFTSPLTPIPRYIESAGTRASAAGARSRMESTSPETPTVTLPPEVPTIVEATPRGLEPPVEVPRRRRWRSSRATPYVPRTWRRDEPPEKPLRLLGVGLGLFGLRPVPMTGRDEERDRLWALFREVVQERRPRAVLLRGPSGVGKSRLAEWMTQRLHELGLAEIMTASHGPFPGPSDGIPGMLAGALRCRGLPRRRLERHIRYVLAHLGDESELSDERLDYLARALLALIAPSEIDALVAPSAQVQFGRQTERYAIVHQLVMSKQEQRPVAMWLDDVQWGRESLGLMEYLLDHPRGSATLILATVREGALAERPFEADLVRRLLSRDDVSDIELGPLPDEAQLSLVGKMLGLESSLAREVTRRTSGNPLFAIQLVGDWVERGVLVASDEGFTLREGERAEIPDTVHEVWRRRLEALTSHFDVAAATRSLELAAALGVDVDHEEWSQLCARSGVEIPRGLLAMMEQNRLAVLGDGTWSFAHTMFHESLTRLSRAEGHWAEDHVACAALLREACESACDRREERIGLHLLEAGEDERALAPLLEAASCRHRRGDSSRALELCELREGALRRLDAPASDPRWSEGWLLSARCRYKRAEYEEGERLLDLVEQSLPDEGPSELRATALRVRAQITRMTGDMRRALTLAEAARREFAALDDHLAASDCDLILARLHLESTGDHRRGLALASTARDRFREAGDHRHLAECAYITGHLSLALGDTDGARKASAEARSLFERVGDRFGLAACANFQGEIARMSGRFAAAVDHYDRAIQVLQSMGSGKTIVPRLNLALTLVQEGRASEAEPSLQELRREGGEGVQAVLCFARYALLVCAAARGSWKEYDEHLEAARGHRPETGRVDQDLASLAEQAADLASAGDQLDRARRAYALAAEHWRALEREDRIARAEARARATSRDDEPE